MRITEEQIKAAHKALKNENGGAWQDYFGLLFLEEFHKVPREQALHQIAFGGEDYGIDGYHFDKAKRNLYLFQFRWSNDHEQFKPGFRTLLDHGVSEVFGSNAEAKSRNAMVNGLKQVLRDHHNKIDQVNFHFVFTGEPEKAENSSVLSAMREDLENKKHVIDSWWGREMNMVIEYRSLSGKRAHIVVDRTHEYPLKLSGSLEKDGPQGQQMIIGMGRLYDLYGMFRHMGSRFFERNIRHSLPEDGSVNRILERAFRDIGIDKKLEPAMFAFNHNGVTFSAQRIEPDKNGYRITEPRLLNGAQTITTMARFIEKNKGRDDIETIKDRLKRIEVICKVIIEADDAFITTVTINNNRQNPVDSWNLRANDQIQLELSDHFRTKLGMYYERQQRAFEGLTEEERDEQGITDDKAVQLLKLAQTFLASEGELVVMRSMRKAFEEDKQYDAIFNMKRLDVDPRYVVLCYKVQFRLPLLTRSILERGENKYSFVGRGRHLLWALMCQAILNDKDLHSMAERYGQDLAISANYMQYIGSLATGQCRALLSELVELPANAEAVKNGEFNFLRSKQSFDFCMEVAKRRFGWEKRKLSGSW
ncbi:MAG: AIPR family protein [Flavobacteriales bacterium]|jgi:hypothetical protein|nr:AIPR family protein [Flavobacteriales bacterium]MBK6883422.1 AIPR family protein [Flavobacteriales bacterium]MBK7103068.1 AIPR family protein [Flavobacteriales bacterium]MBK7113830.1 AIPR family protein [Flavobacteriales bacterium]MBK7620792.1 AIPR family protein [Flavobacteriales bacterium]